MDELDLSSQGFANTLQNICLPGEEGKKAQNAILQLFQASRNPPKAAQDFLRVLGNFCGVKFEGKFTHIAGANIGKAIVQYSSDTSQDPTDLILKLLSIEHGSKRVEGFEEAVRSILSAIQEAGQRHVAVLELAQILALGGDEVDVDRDAAALQHDYRALVPGSRELFWKNLPTPISGVQDENRVAQIQSRIDRAQVNEIQTQEAWKELVRLLSGKAEDPALNKPEGIKMYGPHTIENIFDMVRDKNISTNLIVEALQGQPKLRAELKYRLVTLKFAMPDGFVPNIDDKSGIDLKQREIDAVQNALKNPEGKFNKAAWEIIATIMKRSPGRFRPHGV